MSPPRSLSANSAGSAKRSKKASSKIQPKRKIKPVSMKKIEAYQKKIKLLKHSERNSWIYLTNCGHEGSGKKAFAVKKPDRPEMRFTGLTKRLKEILYPDTEENPMLQGAREKSRSHKYYKPRATKQEKPRACGTSGSEHGTLVHGQIDYYIKCLHRRPGLTLDECFKNLAGGYDRCTRSIIEMIAQKEWIVEATEFKIFDEDCRVATSIDILVKDPAKQKLILLEVKTGYEGQEYGYHPNDEPFPAPFDNITNCPKNRHMLQMMAMKEFLDHKYHVKIDDALIVRVLPNTNNRVVFVKLADWAKTKHNRANLYEMLKASSSRRTEWQPITK